MSLSLLWLRTLRKQFGILHLLLLLSFSRTVKNAKTLSFRIRFLILNNKIGDIFSSLAQTNGERKATNEGGRSIKASLKTRLSICNRLERPFVTCLLACSAQAPWKTSSRCETVQTIASQHFFITDHFKLQLATETAC